MAHSNFYEIHGPNPGGQEREGQTWDAVQADNPHRRGRGFDESWAWDGTAQGYHGAFAAGVVGAHGGDQYVVRTDHAGRAPAPSFPERAANFIETKIGDQANGRNPLGATNPRPTWDAVDAPQLGNFADAATQDAHGVWEVKISGEGGRRQNAAQVRP